MASAAYTKLKEMLQTKGELSAQDIETVTKEHGALVGAEHIELEALKLKLGKKGRAEISMEDYVAATKILDTAAEGSEEYQAAETIVNAFESGG